MPRLLAALPWSWGLTATTSSQKRAQAWVPGTSSPQAWASAQCRRQSEDTHPTHAASGCPALPPPRAGGAQPPGRKAPPGPAAQICLERRVSTQGSLGHCRQCGELGAQSSAPGLWGGPVPRDARPVLGPAALLCHSVPWASSLVQHRRLGRVAGRPGVSLAQGGMWGPQVLWCRWSPKVWLGRMGERGAKGVGWATPDTSPTSRHPADVSLPMGTPWARGRQSQGPTHPCV